MLRPLAIEAPVIVPEDSASRSLVIVAVGAQRTVLRPLAIEAVVPKALAAKNFVIKALTDIAADDCQNSNIKIGYLCRARKSTTTMRIDWDVMDPEEGSHVGWGVISAEDSEEIIALYVYLYVIISSSSGALWIMYYAKNCMGPVEAWWTGVPDAGLLSKLDCATGGVTEHSRFFDACARFGAQYIFRGCPT